MTEIETFTALRAQKGVSTDALLAFFDGLPAVPAEHMLGAWTGGCFDTGHPGEAQLVALGWVGKTFHAPDDVDPIVVRGPDGARVASPVLGKASLRSVLHRGVVTATMIYDKHPIFDHFRAIDAGTVLGCMDRKGEPTPLMFWLARAIS